MASWLHCLVSVEGDQRVKSAVRHHSTTPFVPVQNVEVSPQPAAPCSCDQAARWVEREWSVGVTPWPWCQNSNGGGAQAVYSSNPSQHRTPEAVCSLQPLPTPRQHPDLPLRPPVCNRLMCVLPPCNTCCRRPCSSVRHPLCVPVSSFWRVLLLLPAPLWRWCSNADGGGRRNAG